MIAFSNHEKVGSRSNEGAMSPFLKDTLKRIYAVSLNVEEQLIFKQNSLIISNDVAHAFNPNFPEKYDSNHRLFFDKGIAIKTNANQNYATNGKTQAMLETVFIKNNDLRQYFSADNSVGCGSTVGPISASVTGIPANDVGPLVLTMHGSREIADCLNILQVVDALTHVFEERKTIS